MSQLRALVRMPWRPGFLNAPLQFGLDGSWMQTAVLFVFELHERLHAQAGDLTLHLGGQLLEFRSLWLFVRHHLDILMSIARRTSTGNARLTSTGSALRTSGSCRVLISAARPGVHPIAVKLYSFNHVC